MSIETHVLRFGDFQEISFRMPETPLEAATMVAYLLDEYTGNSLNYPDIVSVEEAKAEADSM